MPYLAAFEIAEELLRHAAPASAPREHAHFFLLLAHYRADLLSVPCRDVAAAAVSTALRIHAGLPAGRPAPAEARLPPLTDAARACAARMWAVRESGQPVPAAGPEPAD